jgi:hypothetical protein
LHLARYSVLSQRPQSAAKVMSQGRSLQWNLKCCLMARLPFGFAWPWRPAQDPILAEFETQIQFA